MNIYRKKPTIREITGGEVFVKKPLPEMKPWYSSRVNAGMITSMDESDILDEALVLAKNAKVEFDKTSRRDGSIIFGPTPPDTNPVLKMASIKLPNNDGYVIRFTHDGLYLYEAGIYTPIVGVLTGTVIDRFRTAIAFDQFAFSNNGADPIQVVDFALETFGPLAANMPAGHDNKFRYITSFFNRIFAAAWKDNNEVELAWSGEYGSNSAAPLKGLEDWDSLVNSTAGSGPLIESPNDQSDHIKGIFGISNAMVILREKSIWLGVKQASATNPINPYPIVPGIGCDSPYTAQVTSFGVSWLDRRTRTVYNFIPGSQPEPIGSPIEKTLINSIYDPDTLFGVYDPIVDTYSVCIPASGSNFVQIWTFYFKFKAWTYNEMELITSFDNVELLTGNLRIDDLIGTIDGLVGTIDDLRNIGKPISTRVYGREDGSLTTPDENAETDAAISIGLGVAYQFPTELISKTFDVPTTDIYVVRISITYRAKMPCNLEIWYSRDGGVTWVFGDTFNCQVLDKNRKIIFDHNIYCEQFAFKLLSDNGQFDVLGYECWINGAGVSQLNQL